MNLGTEMFKPGVSQIEYVPFNEKYPESLTRDMNTLLLALQNGEIKTNVTFESPEHLFRLAQ